MFREQANILKYFIINTPQCNAGFYHCKAFWMQLFIYSIIDLVNTFQQYRDALYNQKYQNINVTGFDFWQDVKLNSWTNLSDIRYLE